MAKTSIPHSLNPRNDLTADFVRSIMEYDHLTGIFRWLARGDVPPKWNGRYAGKIAGTPRVDGATVIKIYKRAYAAHRLAWLYVTGEWPKNDIDHIDTNNSNNKFTNLRPATDTQNNCNRGPYRNNKSGIKGVSPHGDKWVATIGLHGKSKYLGIFDTKEAAGLAYQEAAMRLHGEFARLV